MTSATYETSTFASLSSAHDIRRPLVGSFSSTYASPYSASRRRSSSPGPSSRRHPPYDIYAPRGGPSHDYNIYRSIRRPERYSSRSPSSDRYERFRPTESRPWDSSTRFQPSWQDRRSSPSPVSLREVVSRDTMAARMFEPSASWKQSHTDRSGRYESMDAPISRFPEYRSRLTREYSPKRSPVYPPAHVDNYRPYSSGQGYRDSHALPRSDSYRPQYDDSAWRSPPPAGDKLSTDFYHPRRPTSQHDHDDARSSTSIASTPPRRALDSPPPDPHPTHRDPHQSSSFCRHTSPSHSVVRSRTSSTASEPARKRRRSRSTSRSSASSRADESAVPARNHLDDSVSMRSVQQVMVDGFSRDRDQLAYSIPNTHLEPNSLPHELPHADAKPVHSVMNGELDKLPSGLSLRCSSPNLLSREDIEMSPPGLIASHSLPGDVEFAFLGHPPQAGTESQIGQTSNPFDEAGTQPVTLGAPSLALKSVEVDKPPASANVPPSSESKIREGEANADLPQTLAGNATLLNSLPHVTIESVDSPSHTDAVERLVAPACDMEQPAAWSYDRSLFAEPATKALRLVVLTRLQCDRQTRDERVVPVLRANLAIREPSLPSPTDTQDKLFQEFAAYQREAFDSLSITKSLSAHFLEREITLQAKQQRLRDEYLELHQQWTAQCARLDNVSKGGPPEESIPPSAGGRSTRRSTAVLGDAVRSDLEMEQIIANLGMEELTDPSYLAIKNVAKIPDMISVTERCGPYYYDDTNNLVDDPAEFYSASSGLDLWTEEERTVFLERYAAHPKQFGLIAQHLPNKTAAQCITYYYLHKKQHVDFRKAIVQYGAGRRRRNGKGSRKQKGNALLADIRRHDDEVLAAHPIESPSPVVAVPSRRRRADVLRTNGEPRRYNSRRGAVQHEQTPTSSGTTPDPEADEQKRRRRSTIRSSGLAQEEAEPEPNDQEPEVEAHPVKQIRKPRKPRARAIPMPSKEATPSPDLLDYCETSLTWFKEDKNAFIGLLSQHGDNGQFIPPSVPHKTAVQVSGFHRSFVNKLASTSPQSSALFDSPIQ